MFPIPPPVGKMMVGHFFAHYVGAVTTFVCMVIPLIVSEGFRAWPAYLAGSAFIIAFACRVLAQFLGLTVVRWNADCVMAIMEWAMVGLFYLCLIRAANGQCLVPK